MKFHSIKDGTYEDGGVFQPLEEHYRQVQAFIQECQQLLQLYCEHKARFNDKQHWQVGDRQCSDQKSRDALETRRANERQYVKLALVSTRLALQEADRQADNYLKYLGLSRDTLKRCVPSIKLAVIRYAAMNNCILAEALHRKLYSLQLRLRSTIDEDITEGLGNIEFAKYFAVLRSEALEGPVREVDDNQFSHELAYVPHCSGLGVMNSPASLDLNQSVAAMQALLAKVAAPRLKVSQLNCDLDPRNYGRRVDSARQAGEDANYYRLLSEWSVARSEVASFELEIVLLLPEIQVASEDLYKKLWAFSGAKEKQHDGMNPRAVSILINNFVFAEVLNRKAVSLMKLINNIIAESRSTDGLLAIFNEDMPFPVRGIVDSFAQ